MVASSELTVADNPDRRRYEARVGSEIVGFIDYREAPGKMKLMHTEVEPALGGRGVASQLVAWTLDDIRRRGLSVVPFCPFVVAYLRRHPEYSHLVSAP
ncbi:MAG TPA: GNAT family N-acetyltransferase [Gaiellaceae bacterium]|nr:GNAT family N-acetyltransferase [Gaiellaceae bacterium]